MVRGRSPRLRYIRFLCVRQGPAFQRNIPYIAHKKLAMVTPSAHGWRVNKSVLLGEIDRIYHKVRPSLAYQPTEDYLNSRAIVSFDDETRSIRAQTADLLKKIYTPIPRAQRPLPLAGELLDAYAKIKNLTMRLIFYPRYLDNYCAYYSHSELPITERITSDHYIDRLLSSNRNVQNNVLTMSYYDEPGKRYGGIGKGHLACVSFAGGRPFSRRKNLASTHDNIRNDINVLSHYGRFRAAAAAANVPVPESDYIPPSYQAPTKSAVTGSWKSNAPSRTGSDRSDRSRDSGYRPRELKAGAEFDAAMERKKKRREALEAAAWKEAQEEKRHKQREDDISKLAALEKEEEERKQREEAERVEAERVEAERKAKEEAERKAKEEEEARLRKEEEERKAKEEAAKKAEEEKRKKEEQERLAKEEAERKAKEEEERKAKEEAERKAREEEERRAKEEEERKAKEEAERLAREEEERRAKEEAERLAREEEERKAKEEEERLAKEEEERIAKEEAERLAKEEEERLAKEEEEKPANDEVKEEVKIEDGTEEEGQAPEEAPKEEEAAAEEAAEPIVEEPVTPEPTSAAETAAVEVEAEEEEQGEEE